MTGKHKRARRAYYKKRYCINGKLLLSLAVFFIASMIFFTAMVSAKSPAENKPEGNRYYTSVQIEKGDSLWSIAEDYCPDETEVADYVKELKHLNGLSGDEIHAGNYISVYYYAE